ncbi:MAG: type II toxin-antitoxin system Phd/YefM family antitoxin [Solirubrobacterales bacterium]
MEVGVREFKARLSEHLRRVAAGERITITSRGRPVAEVLPAGARRDPAQEHLARLIAEGRVTPPTRPRSERRRARPVPAERSASELIIREREEERRKGRRSST